MDSVSQYSNLPISMEYKLQARLYMLATWCDTFHIVEIKTNEYKRHTPSGKDKYESDEAYRDAHRQVITYKRSDDFSKEMSEYFDPIIDEIVAVTKLYQNVITNAQELQDADSKQ